MAAIDKIREAVDSGQIRRFTGNDYTEDITSGNAVASIGWSGDAYLIANENAEWRMPDEGCMLWTDNMVIPVGAPNDAAALEYMNYVYEPEVQAPITELHQVRDPGRRRQGDLREGRQQASAKNPLIFPDDEFTAELHRPGEPAGREHRGHHLRSSRTSSRGERRRDPPPATSSPPASSAPGVHLAGPLLRRAHVLHGRDGAPLGLAGQRRVRLHLGVVELPRRARGPRRADPPHHLVLGRGDAASRC